MIIKRNLVILFVCSFILSISAHLFFLKEWTEGQYMVGPNDGLQQMVTFKKLLYEQYTSGNFFYAYQFGLGGGTYSQLAFYFSTSFVFIVTTAVVYLLESIHLIGTPDIIFWAKAAVFVSVGRLTFIIFLTTLVFRYMRSSWSPAFIGASVYGLSIIYYRHVTYWEFFADAMLWIPLLVFGVEKIIREARAGWFTIAVSITLINNFYFAYVNLIFILIYVLFRWIIQLEDNETSKWKQFRLYVSSGLIGFGISAVAFVPAVYSFFNNHRPPYRFPIELFHFSDNILFTSRFVIIPTLFLLFLFLFSLYKIRAFRFFTTVSVLFILLHFSPFIASIFNGFSAPQYRWEYLLSFMMGGSVAAGLTYLNRVSKSRAALSSVIVATIYLVVCFLDRSLGIASLPAIGMLFLMIVTMLLLLRFIWKRNKTRRKFLHGGILLSLIVLANVYQYALSEVGDVKQVSASYLRSENYNGKEQRELLEQIKNRESGQVYRIDWKVDSLNNTPIVQDFNGMSVYSSILNQNLLFFYLYDLKIDMGRESVSRYATLGNRANLYSLLQGKYMIREKENKAAVPYGFEKIMESENYVVYQNTNVLPFVRTTSKIFSEKDMEDTSVLKKEHAMLEGVIIANRKPTNTEIDDVHNMINKTSIETVGASFQNNTLSVREKTGGIDLIINANDSDTEDYYVSFHLESLAKSQGFTLKVNDYRTTRKHNQSIYKTYVDDLTIRVPKAKEISIRVPRGDYILKDLELYKENYHTLESITRKSDETARINWVDNRLVITYNNRNNDRYMVLPIPYERGWELNINNEKQPIEKVNYAFLGFPVKEGTNTIELVYYPPFFKISLILTITSILLFLLIIIRKRYLNNRKLE